LVVPATLAVMVTVPTLVGVSALPLKVAVPVPFASVKVGVPSVEVAATVSVVP